MLAEEAVEGLSVTDDKLARPDPGVVDTQERVDVVHGLCAHVGEFLDLASGILDLRV